MKKVKDAIKYPVYHNDKKYKVRLIPLNYEYGVEWYFVVYEEFICFNFLFFKFYDFKEVFTIRKSSIEHILKQKGISIDDENYCIEEIKEVFSVYDFEENNKSVKKIKLEKLDNWDGVIE